MLKNYIIAGDVDSCTWPSKEEEPDIRLSYTRLGMEKKLEKKKAVEQRLEFPEGALSRR